MLEGTCTHRPAQFIGPAAGYYVVGRRVYSSVVGVFTWGYDMKMRRGGFFGLGPSCCWNINVLLCREKKRKEKEVEKGGNMDSVSDKSQKH